MEGLKDNNLYGFDVVVEATGVEKLADESINYVRRGGTLMIYGVYENKALVHWLPSKVHAVLIASHSSSDIFSFLLADFFGDEIEVSYVSPKKLGSYVSFIDHWAILLNLLFPSRCCVS